MARIPKKEVKEETITPVENKVEEELKVEIPKVDEVSVEPKVEEPKEDKKENKDDNLVQVIPTKDFKCYYGGSYIEATKDEKMYLPKVLVDRYLSLKAIVVI